MAVTQDLYDQAYTFREYRRLVGKHDGLWNGIYDHLEIPEDAVKRLKALPDRRYVLVLAEDWCGDAASLVPVLAKMADAAPGRIELRVLKRDENLGVMDSHLSHGGRAIPVAIVFDDTMQELGWWGPRPGPAQALFRQKIREFENRGSTDKNGEVYRPILRWYREDRGRHTIDEFLNVLERGGELRD